LGNKYKGFAFITFKGKRKGSVLIQTASEDVSTMVENEMMKANGKNNCRIFITT
jgi:hypothetical protein